MANDAKIVITAEDRASATLAKLKGSLGAVDTQAGILRSTFGTLGTAAATAAAAFGGREIIRSAEAYQTLTARLKLTTASQEAFKAAQEGVFGVSQRTRADLESTSRLYTRIADDTRKLGASQSEQLKFVELVNQSLAISGSTGEEAASVLLQLSQALGSGALRGQEFNAVNENGQRLMRALGDATGKTTGELRKMAEVGQLTSDIVFRALLSQAGKLQGEFDQLPETVSGAFTRLNNSFQKFVGQTNSAFGGTNALAAGITAIANNFDVLGNAALSAGAVIASVFSGRLAGAIASQVAALKESASAQIAGAVAAGQARTAAIASAEAELVAARAHAEVTAATLAEVRANQANIASLAIYGETRAAANRQELIAAAAHTAATEKIAASQAALAAATVSAGAGATAAASGIGVLRVAIGALGGPIGLIITALSLGSVAWLTWGRNAETAAEKARKKLEETAAAARRVVEQLRTADAFGTGDSAVLRERAAQLEARIAVLAQSSGKSAGAAEELANARKELEETNAALAKLEDGEKKAAAASDSLKLSLVDGTKNIKKGVEDTTKAYESLRNALTSALEAGIAEARKLRDENKKTTDELLLSVSELDRVAKAKRAQAGGELSPGAGGEVGSSLSGSRADTRASTEAISASSVAIGISKATTAAASDNMAKFAGAIESAKKQLEDLAKSGEEETSVLEGLAAQLAKAEGAVNEKKAASIDEQIAGQSKILSSLDEQLTKLKEKAGDIKVNLDISKALEALDALAKKVENAIPGGTTPGTYGSDAQGAYYNLDPLPAFADGGAILGPGGPRDDKVLMWGSAGEYVQPHSAVAHYGTAFMEAIRTLKLPRFASGGPIIPTMRNAAQVGGGDTINLSLNGYGPFPLSSAPDVTASLQRVLSREALKRGSRV